MLERLFDEGGVIYLKQSNIKRRNKDSQHCKKSESKKGDDQELEVTFN